MHIVVLIKPVPDPAAAAERLDTDFRLDRAASPAVVNANDEYALEAALKLTAAHGGEVTIMTMAPQGGAETMRKGLAMGASRGILVSDPALAGSDVRTTIEVLAATLRSLAFDLVLAGTDTSDGVGGVVPAGIAARLLLPYLSNAASIEADVDGGLVRVRRLTATGHDLLEAPMPALVVCTQALGEPRYPSLKGIMAARSKEIVSRSLTEIGVDPLSVGGAVATTVVMETERPPLRAATRVVRGTPTEGAAAVVELLAARRII